MVVPRGASHRAVLFPPRFWRDSSQACSDEETGDSTHSGTLAPRHGEGDMVSMGWLRVCAARPVEFESSPPNTLGVVRLSWTPFGLRGASEIERAPAAFICQLEL